VRVKDFVATFLAGLVLAAIAAFPVAAQDKGPFGGFKHDSKAPIEISADSLEVRQADSQATFTGKVVAGQGTLRLTADKVVVTYSAEGSGSTGRIRNMRADGHVFLSNGAETAQGDWAEYDVADGMVSMGGSVILTQGQNAISGNALVIDLNTGVGRVEGRAKVVFESTKKQ